MCHGLGPLCAIHSATLASLCQHASVARSARVRLTMSVDISALSTQGTRLALESETCLLVSLSLSPSLSVDVACEKGNFSVSGEKMEPSGSGLGPTGQPFGRKVLACLSFIPQPRMSPEQP